MCGLFVIFGAISLLVVGAVHASVPVVLAASGVLGIFAMLLWIDVWIGASALKRLISDGNSASGRHSRVLGIKRFVDILSRGSGILSGGQSLLAGIRVLQSRLHIVGWELEVATADLKRQMVQSPESPLLLPVPGIREEAPANLQECIRLFLLTAQEGFRNSVAVVVVQGECCVVQGNQGQRFETACKVVFEEALTHDRASEIDSEVFALFGYRHGISVPFWLPNSRGVLWLGYSRDRSPTQSERDRAVRLGRELQRELELHQERKNVSARIMRAEQRSESSSKLITEISHDIRSPLNNLKAILGVLRLEDQPQDLHQLLDVASRNCEGLEEMVSSLVDFSRAQTGTLNNRPEQVNVCLVLRDLAESFQVTASLKHLKFEIALPDTDTYLFADRVHVRRIVSNLLSNAFKYTESGVVRLALTRESTKNSDQDEARIVVSDSGAGMTAAQLHELFTPFKRFQPQLAEGIGLGLTLTRSLVHLNSGNITVRSDLGKGSEFVVSFPVSRGVVQSSDRARVERQVRVLLVDDDRDGVDSLARALSTRGVVSLRAYSVSDAVKLLNDTSISVVISDAHMPGGGGVALLESDLVQRRKVPVILLTGDQDAQKFLLNGAAEVFLKPVDVDSLLESVRALVSTTEPSCDDSSSAISFIPFSEVA